MVILYLRDELLFQELSLVTKSLLNLVQTLVVIKILHFSLYRLNGFLIIFYTYLIDFINKLYDA